MLGAPSILPEVGWGLWLPRFHACTALQVASCSPPRAPRLVPTPVGRIGSKVWLGSVPLYSFAETL